MDFVVSASGTPEGSKRTQTHSNAPTTPHANKYVEMLSVGSFDVFIEFQRPTGASTHFNVYQKQIIFKLIN